MLVGFIADQAVERVDDGLFVMGFTVIALALVTVGTGSVMPPPVFECVAIRSRRSRLL